MGPLTWGLKGACFPRAAAEPMSMKATLTPGLQLLLAAFVMFPEITMRTCAWHGEQKCTNAECIQTTAIVAFCAPRITTIVPNCARLQLLRNLRCNDVRAFRIIFTTVFGKGSKRK